MQLDWDFVETIAKAVVVIGGMLVSLYQIYTRLPKSRGSLTRDLEILKLLDKDDPAYEIIRAHVDKQVEKIYEPSAIPAFKKPKIYSWANFILGIVILVIFAPWTYSLYLDKSWWALLTGFVAFGGIGNIGMAFDKSMTEQNIDKNKG